MTTKSDIIDGGIAAGRKYGLVYTKKCGWVDLGHANPEGALSLWEKILNEKDEGAGKSGYFRVSYTQMMGRKNLLKVGVLKKYDIQKNLSEKDKKSVALAIFLDVSNAFESMQANWFFSMVSNSGYSAEDLVSNLIGLYRAIDPNTQYINLCEPVSKEIAYQIWDKYGAVGNNKNYSAKPYLYPIPPESGSPTVASLPPALNTIQPAKHGFLYKEVK